MEFDIEEKLAEKFSQILPSALLLIVLPFVVLRWSGLVGKLIIWAILITSKLLMLITFPLGRALLLEWDCALVHHQVASILLFTMLIITN